MANSTVTYTGKKLNGDKLFTSDGEDGKHTGTYVKWDKEPWSDPYEGAHWNDNPKSDSYGKLISNEGWHVKNGVWQLKPGTASQRKEKFKSHSKDTKSKAATLGEEIMATESDDKWDDVIGIVQGELDNASDIGGALLGAWLGDSDMLNQPLTLSSVPQESSSGVSDDTVKTIGLGAAALAAFGLLIWALK